MLVNCLHFILHNDALLTIKSVFAIPFDAADPTIAPSAQLPSHQAEQVLSLIASVVSHFGIAVASMLVCCGMLGMRATVTVWRGTRQPSRKNLDPVLHLPSTAINHELC